MRKSSRLLPFTLSLLLILVPHEALAAQHPSYSGFASPVASFSLNNRNVTFATSASTAALNIATTDTAVYRYAYVSYDGGAWTPVALSGNALGGAWLNGSSSASVTIRPENFTLSSTKLTARRNFVVTYSCSRTAQETWNCHDGWQIWQFNATLNSGAPCTPSCACAAATCTGSTCSNGCSGTCTGTLQPNCAARTCGAAPNGCGNSSACGTCAYGYTCNVTGRCVQSQAQVIYALNCGGTNFTATSGVTYVSDSPYTSGTTGSTTSAISGTTNDALYQTYRYSAGTLSYTLPVASEGDYNVTLHFTEVITSAYAGYRIFDVIAEGAVILDNFDIFAQKGAALAAVDVSRTVHVSDGTLNLQLVPIEDVAGICGIIVTGQVSDPTCSDGIKNQGETGTDCGGPCPACPPSCSDGIQNGAETGIDCGGTCPACPTCSDGIMNGNEAGMDCGGTCPLPCDCTEPDTRSCTVANGAGLQTRACTEGHYDVSWDLCLAVSCNSGYHLSGGACVQDSCTDRIRNQGETGIDCGGPCGDCNASCSDGIKTGAEAGVDCGGACGPCPAYLRAFYVNQTGGNDNNDGLSQSTPWKTIAKVNTQTFQPGDAILFRRGDTWRESLEVDQSGTAGAYITYSAHGNGPKPRILGSTNATSWTRVGTSNVWESATTLSDPWTVITASGTNSQIFFLGNDASVTWGYHRTYDVSFSALTAEYDWTWNNNRLYIYSPTDPNARYSEVEAPQRQYAAIVNYVEYTAFDNLELAYLGGYGIRDAYGPRTLSGLRVTNMHIHHIGRKGSNVAYGTYNYHSNAYYAYNDIHDCGRRSISVAAVSFATQAIVDGILIEYNHFHHGFHTTGVDITPSGSGDHIIRNIVIRNNYFEGHPDVFLRGGDRADLYYDDGLNTNHIYISNENTGTGGGTFNIDIYNNVFTYSSGKSVQLNTDENARVYYNTFYGVNPTIANTQAFIFIMRTPNVTVMNNLVYGDMDYSFNDNFFLMLADPNLIGDGISAIDRNLYYSTDSKTTYVHCPPSYYFFLTDWSVYGTYYDWADYKSITGWDASSPAPANPLFAIASGDQYRLQSGSPAVGAATPIPWITTDYNGNPRNPTNPSIGAFEYTG